MNKNIFIILLLFALSACSPTAREISADAVSVNVRTRDGLYKIFDDEKARKLQVDTTIGLGAQIHTARAADQYLSQYRQGCNRNDMLSLGAGIVQGTYLVSYVCD